MTITQLRFLLALERYGSYVEAAKSLSVTQPALTIQIKNLEEELGVTLFDRNKKPIDTTAAGKILADQARIIMLEIDKAVNMLDEFQHAYKGILYLGIIPTIAPYLLPLFLQEFQQKYPDVKLQIKEMITEDIIVSLKNSELDAGIVATPITAKAMSTIPLFYEKYFLYVSETHHLYKRDSVSISELEEGDLWVLNQGNCFRNQVLRICSKAKKSVPYTGFNFESHSIESLKRIVEFTNGTTVIPELATLNVPVEKEDMIKPLTDIEAVREVSIITNRTVVKENLINKLNEVIKDSLPSAMLKKPTEKILETDVNLAI
ncbi:hydrogen peroxide-inducible genes activator [Chondrinema litorale]|uniref:hydrogen peroxide-inducible genes activator n=1 Tax=Chondrinema litorale TaxID=2994555 RepID=UPI00254331EC|nr:hydrogen peroxide-inducible genes activator [Chondrinema litorale]UZR92605.1 hydrogen peroxide-inducible genes activator [Chondrinema litorale]